MPRRAMAAVVALVLLAGAGAAGTRSATGRDAVLDLTLRVDFGADRGQNFGSLFEVTDAGGRVVAGAGFVGLYNTRYRMDRHTLQFFLRAPEQQPRFTTRRLPRPDDGNGLYMFDLDGVLHAFNDAVGGPFHLWDPAARRWRRGADPDGASLRATDGVTRVGKGVLRFVRGRVEYDGRLVMAPPARGYAHHFYYAAGRLFFYHTLADPGGFARIHACPWTPESAAPIDPEKGEILPLAHAGETTFAWGQLGDEVLTVSNLGGVYVHGARGWRVLRPPSPGVSFQVYSMLNYRDRLLLGHYPTGEIYEYDGERLTLRPGWPPRLPGVSGSAREAQTLGLYGGDLFAGVWPWGEVWRHDGEGGRWRSHGRLFTHPEVTDRAVHPYEAEATRQGLVINHWGQRVTSMVALGDSLLLSTSAKSNGLWDPKTTFLTENERREYGAVIALKRPGCLAAPIRWTGVPTELRFRVRAGRMELFQEGRRLAAADLPEELTGAIAPARVRWGRGLFGPLQATLLRADAAPASITAEPPSAPAADPGVGVPTPPRPVFPVAPSPERIDRLRKAVAPLMTPSEADLVALVPDRTGFRFMGCPHCEEGTQEGQLSWSIADPHRVRCRFCGTVFPGGRYPEDRVLRVTNPVGEEVEYPYWEGPSGYRYFFSAKAWREARVYLAARARDLGELYQMTGDAAYARRAALILDAFARYYPGYLVSRDWPHQPKGFALAPPYPVGGGKWGRWRYEEIPTPLVYAYDSISASGELERLARESGADVRARIENDFFRGAIRQDGFHGPLYENASPDTYLGYAVVGRVLGDPALVHEAVRRSRGLFERRFFFDGFWCEGAIGYHRVTLEHMRRVMDALAGYTDPPGYRDPVDGARLEALDLRREIPILARAEAIAPRFRYPDGRSLPVHDSGAIFERDHDGRPLPRSVSTLFPGVGHAWLGRGAGEDQAQLHLHFSGAYGHHQSDNLAVALFAKGHELLSDLGYTHTRYRSWTASTLAHNTLLIDEQEQYTHGRQGPSDGRLLAFETRHAPVQWLEASAERAYPGLASLYRRMVMLVEAGEEEVYAVDLFRVEGGSRHDWALHGSADADMTAAVSLTLAPYGPHMLPGVAVRLPASEADRGNAEGRNPAYGFFRDPRQGRVTDGLALTLALAPEAPPAGGAAKEPAAVRVHLPGQAGVTAFLGEAPSVRRAAENDALLDRYQMPIFLLRSEGEAPLGRCVAAVHEPYRGRPFLDAVSLARPVRGARGTVHLRARRGRVTDHVIHRMDPGAASYRHGELVMRGAVAFVREEAGEPRMLGLWGGGALHWKGHRLTAGGVYRGAVRGVLRRQAGDGRDALIAGGSLPEGERLAGATLLVTYGDGSTTGHTLRAVRREGKRLLLELESEPGFTLEETGARQLFFPLRTIPGPVTWQVMTSAMVTLSPGLAPRLRAVGPARFARG